MDDACSNDCYHVVCIMVIHWPSAGADGGWWRGLGAGTSVSLECSVGGGLSVQDGSVLVLVRADLSVTSTRALDIRWLEADDDGSATGRWLIV